MQAVVHKSEINGTVSAPSSKSFTHRALVAAALAHGNSTIMHPLASQDTDITAQILKNLGVGIDIGNDSWRVSGGELRPPKDELFCRESGTTMRLATALCTLVRGRCTITGEQGLLRRPIGELAGALRQLGADCTANNDLPPVTTNNSFIGGEASLRGDISSQYVSALLFISPLGRKPTRIRLTTPLESMPYVHMTLSTMSEFGISVGASADLRLFETGIQRYAARSYTVEGDWSSAAFLLASSALSGKVTVKNLNLNSTQADVKILDILSRMGADIRKGSGSVAVGKSELHAIDYNVENCPDLFPVLAVLCSAAKGKSTISGIRRLAIKESDRIAEMEKGMRSMGIAFKRNRDNVEITGGSAKGSVIYANDHRIAMAFGVLGIAAEGTTTIKNAECVGKSFPDFWECMRDLNCDVGVE